MLRHGAHLCSNVVLASINILLLLQFCETHALEVVTAEIAVVTTEHEMDVENAIDQNQDENTRQIQETREYYFIAQELMGLYRL